VEIAVPWFLLFNAERHLSSSLAGLLIAAVPIVGAILARATGTDRLDSKRVAGLVLGMGGVGALAGFDVGRSSAWAAASLAVVAVGYALGPWILSRYLAELPGISVVAGSLVICALVYAPAVAFELPTRALSASVIMSMAGLTVACTAIAFVAFFALVGEVGPMRTTVITFVNPAVAVLLGVTVLDEHFGFATAIGFVLVLSGSFLATRPLRAPPAEGAPPEPELEPGAAGRAPVVAEP
jgi:drug/metabolite transporter (DMT)-like permease